VALQSTLELGNFVFEFSRSHTLRYSNTHARTHTHTQTHTPYGSAERLISPSQRPLQTQHKTNTRKEHPSPAIFEPAIPAIKQPHNYALDRTATGTGLLSTSFQIYMLKCYFVMRYLSP